MFSRVTDAVRRGVNRAREGLQAAKAGLHRLALAAGVGVSMAFTDVVPSWAQSTSIFPVSADVATVKADLLLWATALIGVTLAIYAFKRVRGLVNR